MITSDQIDQYRNTAETSASEATKFAAGGATVESELRDALSSKLAANKPLIEGRNEAMANYLATPARARDNFGNPESSNFVFNPYSRGKLIANEQSLAYQPYANMTDYLGLAMGSIGDLAKQGAANYQAQANSKLGAAELAQNQYQNALNEYLQMEQLDLARQKESRIGSESNTGMDQMFQQMLMSILGGDMGGGMEEEAGPATYGSSPEFMPQSSGERYANDEGIVWEFRDNRWYPVGRQ
jgi:hypothetical protein